MGFFSQSSADTPTILVTKPKPEQDDEFWFDDSDWFDFADWIDGE